MYKLVCPNILFAWCMKTAKLVKWHLSDQSVFLTDKYNFYRLKPAWKLCWRHLLEIRKVSLHDILLLKSYDPITVHYQTRKFKTYLPCRNIVSFSLKQEFQTGACFIIKIGKIYKQTSHSNPIFTVNLCNV